MSSQVVFYFLAVLILIAARIAAKRGPNKDTTPGEIDASYNLRQLLIASFLTLFAELAFIRWIAVEVRVFAYFKNLALLLCFVGFGMGCALARKPLRWGTATKALLGLILVIRLPWENGAFLEGLSQSLGGAADVEIWATGDRWNWLRFLSGSVLACLLFLLLVWIFVPLGQTVSRQMDLAKKPLTAYSWNLLGSLAGILAFLGVSRLMLPPWIWLGVVLVGFALLQPARRNQLITASLLAPLALLLHDPSSPDQYSIWTPYQQIEYKRFNTRSGEFQLGMVQVNHIGYQMIADLSPDFLARHTVMSEPANENPYNVPFRFAKTNPKVMIVGSGTGNDVAAAVRHNSPVIDAVEIDPAILALGRNVHPEHPYDSPTVSVHVTDARAFLKRTAEKYDLVLFGLLDSHTQFSDYSNMRIDNFVYTEESFREAKERLEPDGVLFVKFQVNHHWMTRRLSDMLEQTFGKRPVVFTADSTYTADATCFAISPSGRVEQALASDGRLYDFVRQNPAEIVPNPVPLTTDDWPYLYQEGRWIPRTYFAVGVLVILLALGFYSQIPEARRSPPSLFFFAMGAGFLLLETQVISRLALYFGTTWQVNGIVISAMLTALLAANAVVEYASRLLRPGWVLAVLIVSLAGVYWLPASALPGSAAAAGTALATIFSVPVFLAGLLFALEFRKTASPSHALGANILGAVAGGLLENVSLLSGMRSLLLITLALYCVAGLGLWLRGVKSEEILAPG